MTTATEIRREREATMIRLDELSARITSRLMQPLVEKLMGELFTLDRRVWSRYDRCCHGGRRCLPPEDTFSSMPWRPNAYAVRS